jgi:hypothetical protein
MRLRICFALLTTLAPMLLVAKNPTILIKDPPGTPTPVTSNTFAFGANADGGGLLLFQNVSGQTWGTLDVKATLPILTPITCGPGPFDICTVSTTQVSAGFLYDIFFGPASNGGIVNGTIFEVNLNDAGEDPNGTGSWPVSADFTARATVTPEPATWLLLVAGGALAVGRRFKFGKRA